MTIIRIFHDFEVFLELALMINDLLHSRRYGAENISLAILETGLIF